MNQSANKRSETNAPEQWCLRLFVSQDGAATDQVYNHLDEICKAHLEGDYEIKVTNIVKEPDMADTFNIIVIPTLIRISPQPEKRVFGDMTLTDKVLNGLGISG